MHTSLRSLVLLLLAGASVSAQAGGGGGGVVLGGGGGGTGPSVVFNSGPPLAPLPTGTGAISGTIVDGVTRRPVPNAIVLLRVETRDANARAFQRSAGQQLTDTLGRFVFTNLPASDSFSISMQRAGYFGGAYGAGPGLTAGTPIVLAEGEWFSRADITIWPTSGIAGRVTDSYGDPVIGAYVRVLRRIVVGGTPRLAAAPPVTTDDRGAYRVAGLDPGEYLVCVPSVQSSMPSTTPFTREPVVDVDRTTRIVAGRYPIPPSPDGAMVYPGTCYPGVTAIAQAATVDVRFGTDRVDVDFRLSAVRGFRVSGRIEGESGAVSGHTIRLVPLGSEGLGYGSEAATALVTADGAFTFIGVPAGDYVIDARTSASEYTYSPEAVSPLGRFAFGGLPMPPSPSGSMSAMDVGLNSPRTGVRTNGGSGASWGQQRVSVAGQSVAGVVVTVHPAASITGRVVFDSAATKPSQRPTIEVDAADGAASRGRRSMNWVDEIAFGFSDLAPGQYFIRVRGLGDSWAVHSISAGGRDYTRVPFDLSDGRSLDGVVVTMTDCAVALAGTVRDAQGRPLTDAAVLLFPTDRDAWQNFGITPDRIRSIRPASTGTYRFAALVPGDYHVVAVDDALSQSWHDPAFLASVAGRATRVTLSWGQDRTVDLVRVDIK